MFEKFLAMVNACGEDVYGSYYNGLYRLTFCDCEGYDEEREYTNGDAVDALFNFLDSSCIRMVEGYYRKYYLDGFIVEISYDSYDV